jgi:hypothetical protein
MLNLVHRLAGTGLGSQMDYDIDAIERGNEIVAVRHVSLLKVDACRRREDRSGPVNLRRQIIENANPMLRRQR